MLVYRMILWYIFSCVRQGVKPWLYFQLNADYFDSQKKIFSKLRIDQDIPEQWRLPQSVLTAETKISQYPVFVKPEWGQNSYGIQVLHSDVELAMFKQTKPENYIFQQAATENMEIEIFYIRKAKTDDYAVLKVVRVHNAAADANPVNSIHNHYTRYQDVSDQLSRADKEKLWAYLKTMGYFRFARVGLKTNTMAELLQGQFHVIEINAFAPMPLHLLDPTLSRKAKHQFISHSMPELVKMTAEIPKEQVRKRIFFNVVRRHYQIQS